MASSGIGTSEWSSEVVSRVVQLLVASGYAIPWFALPLSFICVGLDHSGL